jgi:HlyD family secretion protein
MKKKSILLLSFLAVALVVAILYFTNPKNKQEVTFITAAVHYGAIAKSVTATGTLQSLDTISVCAHVNGIVSTVYVDLNSIVKKGQLLAKIDTSIIMIEMEVATAGLSSARSKAIFQESNFERQEQLYDKGIISRAEYKVALNQHKSAQVAVTNALEQLKIVTSNFFHTNIYSPIDGVILTCNVFAGQTVASSFSMETLFIIAKDFGKMQIRATVNEADISPVKAGQKVSFTVAAFPENTFQGSVQEIVLDSSVSANVVSYKTVINVENTDVKFRPGMRASITIYAEQEDSVLIIPSRALSFKPESTMNNKYVIIKAEKLITVPVEGVKRDCIVVRNSRYRRKQKAYVWVKKGDTVIEKRIRIGVNDDTHVKVVEGIALDEEVVTYMVKDGAASTVDRRPWIPFKPQSRRGRTSGDSKK